jgi:hypothetical protein
VLNNDPYANIKLKTKTASTKSMPIKKSGTDP